MSDLAIAILARLVLIALCTPAFYFGMGLLGVPISWPIAVVLAVILVVFGWLVIAIAVET